MSKDGSKPIQYAVWVVADEGEHWVEPPYLQTYSLTEASEAVMELIAEKKEFSVSYGE